MEKVGLLAGAFEYPAIIASQAKKQNIQVFTAVITKSYDKGLEKYSDKLVKISPAKLKKIKEFFVKNNVENIVLAGKIEKKIMYYSIPDTDALKLLGKLKDRRDDSILSEICNYFHKNKIEVMDSTYFVKEHIVNPGILAGPSVKNKEWEELRFGFEMAKGIAGLDIGQTVIVKERAVLAVETIEGTDKTIERGASFVGKGAVAVKVSKPGQDLRFDIPAIGLNTVKTAVKNKIRVIGIESIKSLLFQRKESIELARKNRITIVGLPYNWDGIDKSFVK